MIHGAEQFVHTTKYNTLQGRNVNSYYYHFILHLII